MSKKYRRNKKYQHKKNRNLKLRQYLGESLLEEKKTLNWKLRSLILKDALNALILR